MVIKGLEGLENSCSEPTKNQVPGAEFLARVLLSTNRTSKYEVEILPIHYKKDRNDFIFHFFSKVSGNEVTDISNNNFNFN